MAAQNEIESHPCPHQFLRAGLLILCSEDYMYTTANTRAFLQARSTKYKRNRELSRIWYGCYVVEQVTVSSVCLQAVRE